MCEDRRRNGKNRGKGNGYDARNDRDVDRDCEGRTTEVPRRQGVVRIEHLRSNFLSVRPGTPLVRLTTYSPTSKTMLSKLSSINFPLSRLIKIYNMYNT